MNTLTAGLSYGDKKAVYLLSRCLLISIFNGYVFTWLNSNYFHYTNTSNDFNEYSIMSKFMIIVLIALPIETYIFQYIPINYLSKITANNYLIITLPSLLFSLVHIYHLVYALMALFGGFILNFYYLKCKKHKVNAYAYTTILHMLYNLYGFIFVEN